MREGGGGLYREYMEWMSWDHLKLIHHVQLIVGIIKINISLGDVCVHVGFVKESWLAFC